MRNERTSRGVKPERICVPITDAEKESLLERIGAPDATLVAGVDGLAWIESETNERLSKELRHVARTQELKWLTQALDAGAGCGTLRIVDVGSAGGLHGRWGRVGRYLTIYSFDPLEKCAGGRERQIKRYPFGLGAQEGRHKFYQTKFENMSSLKMPIMDVAKRYQRMSGKRMDDQMHVKSVRDVDVRRLDDVLPREYPDFMKIDTQGSEYEVLQGAEAALSASVVSVEVEISFLYRYSEQCTPWDVDRFLRERGFELLDWIALKRHLRSNPLGVGKARLPEEGRTGRIAYGDAVYVLSREELARRVRRDSRHGWSRSLRSCVAAHYVYGKLDECAALLEEYGNALSDEEAAGWVNSIQWLLVQSE